MNNFFFQKGMTIIETMVYIAVFGFLVIAISAFTLNMYQTNAYALEQKYATKHARGSVSEIVENLREASYSEEGAYPVNVAATSSITFYANIDTDSLVERVRYFLDGEELKRGIVEAAGSPPTYTTGTEQVQILSKDVRNIANDADLFTYYDESGAVISGSGSLTDITYILVNMVVNVNPSRAPNDFVIIDSAAIRNLKNNL